jgi:glycine/D-amino acid oxidase-like deaminating enzyme
VRDGRSRRCRRSSARLRLLPSARRFDGDGRRPGGVAGGTPGAGEGNILVSDKEPGPELDLAIRSNGLWRELGDELGDVELEAKGGLVVAATEAEWQALQAFAATQGLVAEPVTPTDFEPHLASGLAGAMFYPQDLQVQPMLAAAKLLQGVPLRLGVTVHALEPGRVVTDQGTLYADAVVNAAGVWAGALGGVPVLPRRGFILVTARVAELVRHKVYAASYVSNVGSGDAGLQTSAVVEGTRAGVSSLDHRVSASASTSRCRCPCCGHWRATRSRSSRRWRTFQ